MKTVFSMAVAGLLLASGTLMAQGPQHFGPIADPAYGAPTPVAPAYPHAAPSPHYGGAPINVYHCVKVEDRDNIHPCAVTKLVSIKLEDKHGCCDQCVQVEVCVPPCACEDVKVSRDGTKVKLDYGKYEVELKSKRGVVYVDYDD